MYPSFLCVSLLFHCALYKTTDDRQDTIFFYYFSYFSSFSCSYFLSVFPVFFIFSLLVFFVVLVFCAFPTVLYLSKEQTKYFVAVFVSLVLV